MKDLELVNDIMPMDVLWQSLYEGHIDLKAVDMFE